MLMKANGLQCFLGLVLINILFLMNLLTAGINYLNFFDTLFLFSFNMHIQQKCSNANAR